LDAWRLDVLAGRSEERSLAPLEREVELGEGHERALRARRQRDRELVHEGPVTASARERELSAVRGEHRDEVREHRDHRAVNSAHPAQVEYGEIQLVACVDEATRHFLGGREEDLARSSNAAARAPQSARIAFSRSDRTRFEPVRARSYVDRIAG